MKAVKLSRDRGDDAKTRILDAAEELMARHGYAGTSMSQICKASRISASAVYWHFESKEGVMAAMLERGITRYLDAVERVSSTPGKSPEDGLRTLFEEIERRPQALRLAIILGMEETSSGSIGGNKVAFLRKRGRAIIRRLVAKTLGIPENDREAERLGGFVISALDGAVILERLDGTRLTKMMLPIFDLLAHYKSRPKK
jgi:AcrR family transcriptional regulator